jgi:hypothetical protein
MGVVEFDGMARGHWLCGRSVCAQAGIVVGLAGL